MPAIPFSKRFRERHPRFTRALLLWVCFVGSFAAGLGFASWAMVCRAGRCPPAQALQGYEPRQTSKLFAVDGRFIAELGLERRTLVKIADIPPLVRSAFVVTEDKRFFGHAGVDWHRVPGALLVDIKNRNFAEGFSTITMQLARNIFPERISRDKSVIRNWKEAKVARSRVDTEGKILKLLNESTSAMVYGIEASAAVFRQNAQEPEPRQAATLAAL
jgi:penicillin-binding protein 1A